MEWKTNSAVLAGLSDFDDRSSWELLEAHFRAPIIRFGQRLGLSESDSEDVAQETLLAFSRSYREGGYSKERGRLRSWLFGIANRQILNARRQNAIRRARETESMVEPAVEDGLEQAWREEWEKAAFERAVAQVRTEVKAATFEVFRLLAFENLDADAVATQLSIPKSRVYNSKHRVATRIRELVEEYDDA